MYSFHFDVENKAGKKKILCRLYHVLKLDDVDGGAAVAGFAEAIGIAVDVHCMRA